MRRSIRSALVKTRFTDRESPSAARLAQQGPGRHGDGVQGVAQVVSDDGEEPLALERRQLPVDREGDLVRDRAGQAPLAFGEDVRGAVVDHELTEQPPAVAEREEGQGADPLAREGVGELRDADVALDVLDQNRLGARVRGAPRTVSLDGGAVPLREPAQALNRITPSESKRRMEGAVDPRAVAIPSSATPYTSSSVSARLAAFVRRCRSARAPRAPRARRRQAGALRLHRRPLLDFRLEGLGALLELRDRADRASGVPRDA